MGSDDSDIPDVGRNYLSEALGFFLEFGRPERRGSVMLFKSQNRANEESLKDAGYLTGVADDFAGVPVVLYAFTLKGWDLYRSLRELERLAKEAEKSKTTPLIKHA